MFIINWFKKYPVSSKFIVSVFTFGLIAVFAGGSWLSYVAAIGFVVDILHFYKSGGAGDK
jgi:hypothetical protein